VEDEQEYFLSDAIEVKEGQSFVTFVVAGFFEWYNKNTPNVLQISYNDNVLTLCKLPPNEFVNTEPTSEDDITQKIINQERDGY